MALLTWYSCEIRRCGVKGVTDAHGRKHRPQVELVVHSEPVNSRQIVVWASAPSLLIKMLTVSVTGARVWTWVRKCPSWFCAGRCPRRPADEQWAGTRGRTAASSSRWAGPPAGSGSDPDTAAPTRCNADRLLSWTDLPTTWVQVWVSLPLWLVNPSIHPSRHCL